jgi:uracil-DNA glycosylase family 4
MDLKEKKKELENIALKIANCKKCPLYKNTTKPVPGEGNSKAEVMFIGEAPGYWEDQRGRPFVGQAGKLLNELLQLIKLPREDVFITNVVKHRPPANRDPLPEEIEACKEFLDAQIKIIDPKIIITLGRFSLNKFLPGELISKIHGQARFVEFAGRKRIVIPMYHPAAALRSERIMEELRSDFKKIPKFLENSNLEKENKEKEENKQLSFI